MNIIFENETDFEFGELEELIEKVALESLRSENFSENTEISFTLTDNEGIRQINSQYRNIDNATDVLSFPLIDFRAENNFDTERTIPLGDIIISIERAKAQAEQFGHSLERELAFLTAHSMMHLLGYDHIDEKCEELIMFDKQEEILDKIGLHRPHDVDLKEVSDIDRMIFEGYLASKNSYSPYSDFPVGACVKAGKEFVRGCNIENSSYPCGICAERTAIFNAVSQGKRDIEGIAIYSRSTAVTYPCGICLQVMSEFMPNRNVICCNRFGKYEIFKLSELLPHGFEL